MPPTPKNDKSDPPLNFPFLKEENRLSMAMENYLLSILRLQEQKIKVSVVQLSEYFKNLPKAEGLGTSLPSVSAMVRRLSREKLIQTAKDKQIEFTTLGLQLAQSILRRHRLASRLAVDILGVELKYAHREAHRLEHAISPYLEHKIIEVLEHPVTCPFGHPIPGSTYVTPKDLIPLFEANPGEIYFINRIPEDDEMLLEYLVENNFLPGKEIVLNDISFPRGVITVSCLKVEVALGLEVSKKIWVTKENN